MAERKGMELDQAGSHESVLRSKRQLPRSPGTPSEMLVMILDVV